MLNQSHPDPDRFRGKNFPCPVCGLALPIRISSKQKPYCVCHDCGLQLFFRGKTGIEQLLRLLESAPPLMRTQSKAGMAVFIIDRLQALKDQRDAMKDKQGFFFEDPDLQRAISVIEVEISQIQEQLAELAPSGESEDKK